MTGFSSRHDLENWPEWRVRSACLIMQTLALGAQEACDELAVGFGGWRQMDIVGVERGWAEQKQSHRVGQIHSPTCPTHMPRSLGSCRGLCIPPWSNSHSPSSSCTVPKGAPPAQVPLMAPQHLQGNRGLVPGLRCLASNPSPSTSQLCDPGQIT